MFIRCLLLQTLPSNIHLHLHISCHSMCLFHQFLTLNTLSFKFLTTSGTHNFTYGLLILLQLPFTCFNTKRRKQRLVPINVNNMSSYFTFLIQPSRAALNKFTSIKVDKNINPVKNTF